MDNIPESPIELPLHSLVHEHRENLVMYKYYYISVYGFIEGEGIDNSEYLGCVIFITTDEIVIRVSWRRYIIEGNEQAWYSIEPENLTFHWLDVDAPQGRSCVRLYCDPRQS